MPRSRSAAWQYVIMMLAATVATLMLPFAASAANEPGDRINACLTEGHHSSICELAFSKVDKSEPMKRALHWCAVFETKSGIDPVSPTLADDLLELDVPSPKRMQITMHAFDCRALGRAIGRLAKRTIK